MRSGLRHVEPDKATQALPFREPMLVELAGLRFAQRSRVGFAAHIPPYLAGAALAIPARLGCQLALVCPWPGQ